jgi:RNA polymerase sigma factor for flagellar operon FliA
MVQYVAKNAARQGRSDASEAALSACHAAALWQTWQQEKSPALREQLIEFYLPLARMLAGSLFRKRTWLDLEYMDYYQYATLGLIESVDRFDPARGVSFATWAGVRMHGAVLNGIESLSEKQAQVSARQRIVNTRLESLQDDHADADTDPNRASADTAPDPDVFAKLAELALGLALGFALEDSGMIQPEQEAHYPDNAYKRLELTQLRQQLQQQLGQLPDNENRVLSYHYLQQLGFDEIGQILQLSKGRISQLHKQGLSTLKSRMGSKKLADFHV